MVTGNRLGQMVQNIQENGAKIEHMVKANLFTLMVMCMMASGLTTKQMVPAFIGM